MSPYWSWVLTVVGVFGLWLAGRKDRRGWMVGLGAQVLWIAYATATHQWGFYVSAVAYGWVYANNTLRVWKEPMVDNAPRVVPLAGQVMHTGAKLDSYEAIDSRYITEDLDIAQVVTSLVAGQSPIPGLEDLTRHKVVLDIDMPAQLVPSSTPGHFHLYIDHEMDWLDYRVLLLALGVAGILEEGYVGASIARGHTALRLPWIKKEVVPF